MSYVSSQGFRLVVPYLDACRVRVKAAWVGRKIEQVRSSPRVALTVIPTLACVKSHVHALPKPHLGSLLCTNCAYNNCVSLFLKLKSTNSITQSFFCPLAVYYYVCMMQMMMVWPDFTTSVHVQCVNFTYVLVVLLQYARDMIFDLDQVVEMLTIY